MIRLSTSYYLNLSNYDDDNLLVVVHQPSSILSAFDLHNLHYLEFTNLLKWQVWSSLVGHKSVGPFLLKFSIALVVGGFIGLVIVIVSEIVMVIGHVPSVIVIVIRLEVFIYRWWYPSSSPPKLSLLLFSWPSPLLPQPLSCHPQSGDMLINLLGDLWWYRSLDLDILIHDDRSPWSPESDSW